MLTFMRAGGLMMWPLLVLGVVAVVGAARGKLHAGEPAFSPHKLALGVLGAALSWSGLGAFTALSYAADVPPGVIGVGLGESLCPAVLGLGVFSIVTMIGALGEGARARLSGQGQA